MEKASKHLIERPEYIEKLKKWKNQSDLVKIITGVRRCGKSKLFVLFQDDLQVNHAVKKEQIISINLEDLQQTRKIGLAYNNNFLSDYTTLLDYVLARLIPDEMNYVFVDEVQLLENWQLVANALRMQENVDLYLTGSNAYMFSGDLANVFGGRYIEIKMQPFSFKEFYHAHSSKSEKNKNHYPHELYSKYIKESAFPQTINFESDRELISDYLLNTVYLNTVQKDIVQRYNVSDPSKLDTLIKYLFDNIGNETSLRNVERQLKASGNTLSAPTIDKYVQALLDAYLLYKCERYDIKGKQILNSNPKYYIVDIGLRSALLANEERDMGHILENIVFLELIRRGYKVHVGKVKTKSIKNADGKTQNKDIEVDFIAQKPGNTIEYYQVALYVQEAEVMQREIASLKEIKDNYKKTLLSMDYGSGEIEGIQRINVFDWLLEYV